MTKANQRPLAVLFLGLVALLPACAGALPAIAAHPARVPSLGAGPAATRPRPAGGPPLLSLEALRTPQPLVLSVSTSPAQVGSHGGSVEVVGRLRHAATCQLRLLSHQSFPVVYASNVRSCTTSFSARVTVGANPTPVERSVAFALVARNGRRRFAGLFYLALAPAARPPGRPGRATTVTTVRPPAKTEPDRPPVTGAAPATSTTSPVPPTSVPASTTTTSPARGVPLTTTTAPAPGSAGPPQVLEESPNWSGYVVKGGPFTSTKGTFTVPSLSAGAACDEVESQWVGIDGGAGPADTDLVQAGVDESTMDPTNAGACSSGQIYAWAWWEILPAAATNVYSVPVHAGDSVTVSIRQEGAGTWQISLTDNTNGQGFSLQQPYTGPGETAEWVTEAPAAPQGNDQICPTTAVTSFGGYDVCPLAPYSPPVQYSGLSLPQSATATELDEVAMVQGGQVVSTPSQVTSLAGLLASGFTTTYGS
jgi:hypothetical protein